MAGTTKKRGRPTQSSGEETHSNLVLLFANGKPDIREFPLEPGKNVIGREMDGLDFGDYFSRRHAVVHYVPPDKILVEDCNSDNGTVLDGANVEGRAHARHQSLLLCDETAWTFSVERGTIGYPNLSLPIVARAAATRLALRHCFSAARANLPVLLLGETGVGKEAMARAVHEFSKRTGPFIPINCGGQPESILEGLLFGHVRGAFTGAGQNEKGVFEAADGGTVFLDEIGEAPHRLQQVLLRVLQEKKVCPLGAKAEIAVDVQIVAATNRDVQTSTDFRFDLFQRLAGKLIAVPPLRERREDILALTLHRLQTKWRLPAPTLSFGVVATLLADKWPGNVRELFNVIDGLCSEGDPQHALTAETIRAALQQRRGPDDPIPITRSAMEYERLLHEHKGVRAKMARESGWSRRTIGRDLKRLGLDKGRG